MVAIFVFEVHDVLVRDSGSLKWKLTVA